MENGNQPAYPVVKTEGTIKDGRAERVYGNTYSTGGLTKREYFAAMAMQGILANAEFGETLKVNVYGIDGNIVADNAMHCADELLKQLEK